MNQLQYAQTVAAAYMRQYGPDASPVMGTPVIIYRSLYDDFDWQSSVHKLEPDEVFVTTVEEEMFGDITTATIDDIVDLVMHDEQDFYAICESIERELAA